jgi:hypothetical protein
MSSASVPECPGLAPFASDVVGVHSSDEDPLPAVGRSDVGRSYAAPPSQVPEAGQVSSDFFDGCRVPPSVVVSPRSKEGRDVFQDDESGS